MANSVKIFAAGGFGINIASELTRFENKKNDGCADISLCFIDTSRSNLIGKQVNQDNLYIFENVDGSGKKRDQNYELLNESVKDILHQHRPLDINIVIHSASGGSGAIVGPLLVTELLKRGELVIPVTVGSNASRIEVENTIKTLKSYEIIAKKNQTPIVACYRENSKETPRGKVDNEITTLLILLGVLFSGQNRELDKADLNNFINYHRVTDFQPKLSFLDFWSKDIVLDKGMALISVASICDNSTSPELDVPVEYQAVGYIQEQNKEILNIQLPVHAGVVSGYFNAKINELEAKLHTFREARQVVVEKSIVNHEIHDATDEGIML